MLLSVKKPKLSESGRFIVDQTTEKPTIMSQQILQHDFGVPAPLGTAIAYHIYNQTCRKSLITLNNKVGLGFSYTPLQRQLTSQSDKVTPQIENGSVYVPETL